MKLYEGMFLLDNQVVRADWNAAKAAVTGTLAKHGAKVVTARRWDERRLAYSIRGRKRGTYLLAYFEQDAHGTQSVRRDLEIDERVLRYLIQAAENGLPEGELEKSQAELEAGFTLPPMPGDDEVVEETVEIDENAVAEVEAGSDAEPVVDEEGLEV